ncbi:MAG TPA: hypothetical protein DCL75_08990 [Ktedonobacter sp.]|nr:hypothetical protein [Ktedonobacter sp.]
MTHRPKAGGFSFPKADPGHTGENFQLWKAVLSISNREKVPLYFRELKTILAIGALLVYFHPYCVHCDTPACRRVMSYGA